ncbi:unnamed protein product [Meganyctiphanes norvegica]|uniref:Uncharacterized protein n=1 Tax=Meganyctiphanes norvegica TaxID=48144 RepID=A0AAV2RNR4_MEGNR
MTSHLRSDGLYLVKGENISRPFLCCPNIGIRCIWYKKPYSSSSNSSSKGTTSLCGSSESYALGSRICYYLVVMAVYITMVVIGVVHWYDCPINTLIPPYLVVGGLCGAAMAVHWMWRLSKGTSGSFEMFMFVLYAFFHIVWFLLGSLWIYGVHPDYEHKYSPNFCQKTLYSFSFWLMHFSMVVLFSSFAWLFLSLLKVIYLMVKLRNP